MKNALLSTTSGQLNAFTSKTMHSCSNLLNSLKAGASSWLFMFVVGLAGVATPGLVFGQAANIDQIRNGGATNTIDPPNWVNGNANAIQAHYQEGNSVGYRMIMTGLGTNVNTVHTLEIEWDVMSKGKHALDFITHYQNLNPHNVLDGGPFNHYEETILPLLGVTMNGNPVVDNSPDIEDIPKPNLSSSVPSLPAPYAAFAKSPSQAFDDLDNIGKEVMTLYNAGSGDFIAVNPITYVSQGNLNAQNSSTRMRIQFTSSNPVVVLAWGGHIASQFNYGVDQSAVFIKGSPYHMRLISIDGSGGNQDRSLAAGAVTPVIPTECNVSGPEIVCRGGDNPVYSVQTNVSGATYSWALSNMVGGTASFVGATNGTSVEVDPGTAASFKLTVTIDPTTGPNKECDIAVSVDDTDADAGADMVINCLSQNGQVSLAGSSATANATYLWTTLDGNIVSGEATLTPVVDAEGTYTLTVTGPNGCTASDDAFVDEDKDAPEALAGADMVINCLSVNGQVQLAGSSSTLNATYLWTTLDGNIVSGETTLTPTVDKEGTYTLTVTGPNGCTASDDAFVDEDKDAPEALAGADMEIDCLTPNGQVQLSGSSSTQNATYLWTTLDGNIVSGEATLTPIVDKEGTYTLTVTGPNGCTASDDAFVDEDKDAPEALAGADMEINCLTVNGQVQLAGSSATANATYLWTTLDGNIVSGETTLTPTVDKEGTYTLTVTGPNGCTASDEAFVDENKDAPEALAGSDMEINCLTVNGQVQLSGSSSTQNATYLWTTLDGNIVSGEATLTPIVDKEGTYTLTVTGPNGCTASDEAFVDENKDLPNVDAGADKQIACGANTVVLAGSSSTQNATYLWTTSNGNIVSGETTLTPTVSAAGTYTLTVTGPNGCTASQDADVSVQVCGDKHCTLTQGGYGNANGKFCGGPRRLELINNLLAQNNMIIGTGTRKITYTAGQGQCIIDKLPAGGTAAAFPSSIVNVGGCSIPNSILKGGRFNNVLIGQVITLSLNTRLDNTLGGVVLTNVMTTYKASDCGPNATPILNDVMSRTIPQSVLTYLGANNTVADLLVLANRALGGETGLPNISQINDAVSAINEVFDGCRILATNGNALARGNGAGISAPGLDKFVKAYPNPFSDKATIELMTAEDLHYSLEMYDINGRLISRLSEGITQAGKSYNFEISAGNMPEGVYLVRFITDRYVETLKVILKK